MMKTISMDKVHTYVVSSVSEFRERLDTANPNTPAKRPLVLTSLWDAVETSVQRPPSIREAFTPST